MTEPVAKPKQPKRRRRSARVYVNLADLPADELERRLAIVSQYFPGDTEAADDEPPASRTRATVGKRHYSQSERRELAREGKALPSGAYPIADTQDLGNAATLARTGHGDVEAARALIARRAKELGVQNPLESSQKAVADPASGEYGDLPNRVSPPVIPGHAAYSVSDHGAAAAADPMRVPGPRELAYRHPDMRQSTTNVLPLFTAFTDADPTNRDLGGMGTGISVAMSRLNAAGATNLSSAPGNPISRPGSHIAPTGAQPANGGHSLSQPEAVHPASMKASDRLEIMKRAMFG